MDCKDIRPLLSAYYDKELDAAERGEVSEHLKSCKNCMAEFSEISSAWDALKAAEDVPVPSGFRLRVTARVSAFSAKRSRRFVWQAAAIAAVFLIAFGIVFMATQPADNPVAQNPPVKTAAPAVDNISAEDAEIIANIDILENYEILDEMDELIDMAALDEITDDELDGVE